MFHVVKYSTERKDSVLSKHVTRTTFFFFGGFRQRLLSPTVNAPLYVAAHNGHVSVTKLLITARCIIDLQDKEGCTWSSVLSWSREPARHLQNTLPSAHLDNMSRGGFNASLVALNANAAENDTPPPSAAYIRSQFRRQSKTKSPRKSWGQMFQSWVSRVFQMRRSLMNLCQSKSGTWTGQPPTEQEEKAARLLQATPLPHHLPKSPSLN